MTARTERALWAVAVLGFALGVGIVLRASPRVAPRAAISSPVPPLVMSFDHDRLADAADRIVQHDPFRLGRTPATVAFGAPSGISAMPPRSQVTPVLVLKGVIGGPPWQAVLAGVPGEAGDVVVRAGDLLAGYRVRQVTATRVTLTGPDSSFTLTPYQAWP